MNWALTTAVIKRWTYTEEFMLDAVMLVTELCCFGITVRAG